MQPTVNGRGAGELHPPYGKVCRLRFWWVAPTLQWRKHPPVAQKIVSIPPRAVDDAQQDLLRAPVAERGEEAASPTDVSDPGPVHMINLGQQCIDVGERAVADVAQRIEPPRSTRKVPCRASPSFASPSRSGFQTP